MEADVRRLGTAGGIAARAGRFSAPWSAPWFDAIRADLDLVLGDAEAGRFDTCRARLDEAARTRGIRNDNGQPIRFVDARTVGSSSYEGHIWASGQVPTRCDAAGAWHDLFNALVWLSFPRTKARLNRLQAEVIAHEGIRGTRGGLRDAATLFDENAIVLVTDDDRLAGALRGFDWQELFVAGRARFVDSARVAVFGHALLDKLRAPYKAVCGHAWIVRAEAAAVVIPGAGSLRAANPASGHRLLDRLLADALTPASLLPAAFSPVPALGIPGWWPENADPAFYRDAAVFRPGRRRRAASAAGGDPAAARTSTGDL